MCEFFVRPAKFKDITLKLYNLFFFIRTYTNIIVYMN
jgi:hypothetical protein